MQTISKLLRISRLALRNPSEFRERLVGRMDRGLEHRRSPQDLSGALELEDAVASLDKALHASISEALSEPSLAAIQETTAIRASKLWQTNPLPPEMNADITLARFCYAACRAVKPLVVIETGVASGVTTSFTLAALAVNSGAGALWSIDLPPIVDNAESYVGAVVPEDLRKRWTLRIGPSKTVLPKLLVQLGSVDVFVHDSLHTRRNMLAEFEMVWPRLRADGLLIADDISLNSAFAEFCGRQHRGVCLRILQKGKGSCFGVIVKQPRPVPS